MSKGKGKNSKKVTDATSENPLFGANEREKQRKSLGEPHPKYEKVYAEQRETLAAVFAQEQKKAITVTTPWGPVQLKKGGYDKKQVLISTNQKQYPSSTPSKKWTKYDHCASILDKADKNTRMEYGNQLLNASTGEDVDIGNVKAKSSEARALAMLYAIVHYAEVQRVETTASKYSRGIFREISSGDMTFKQAFVDVDGKGPSYSLAATGGAATTRNLIALPLLDPAASPVRRVLRKSLSPKTPTKGNLSSAHRYSSAKDEAKEEEPETGKQRQKRHKEAKAVRRSETPETFSAESFAKEDLTTEIQGRIVDLEPAMESTKQKKILLKRETLSRDSTHTKRASSKISKDSIGKF